MVSPPGVFQAELQKLAEGAAPATQIVDRLLEYACACGASDIHLDPAEFYVAVRIRVDGLLRQIGIVEKKFQPEIITRVKILCGLRTDEHQLPQDGRFRYSPAGAPAADVRVSIVPTFYGENAVLRLLTDSFHSGSLDDSGFSPPNRKKIERGLRRPYGAILVTGPTGSGKTTTIYSMLKMLNTPQVSILTIEDPIEYSLAGIQQIPASGGAGLGFARGLRSMLRQDPDIIMVGEIRDGETAGIAVQAALTGHLLLTTLHTGSAAASLPRLLDMGVPAYVIGATVTLVISQRLVRRLCPECRILRTLTPGERESLAGAVWPALAARNKIFGQPAERGCATCNFSGFSGRLAVHEVLPITEALRRAILQKASATELAAAAASEGMVSLLEDGWAKAASGKTSLGEILKLTNE